MTTPIFELLSEEEAKDQDLKMYLEVNVHKAGFGAFDNLFQSSGIPKTFNGGGTEDTLSTMNTVIQSCLDLKEKVIPKIDDVYNKIVDAAMAKDLLEFSTKPSAVFTFPLPVTFTDSMSGNYPEQEMNVTEMKIDTAQSAISHIAAAIPGVGGEVAGVISNGINGLVEIAEKYSRRSSAFTDPNIMSRYTGPNPRRVEFGFEFAFTSPSQKKKVLKNLLALKQYSLASSKTVMGETMFAMNFLRMEHVFSFKFQSLQTVIKEDKTSEVKFMDKVGLNDVLNCSMGHGGIKIVTEPFFLESISISFSRGQEWGYYYDGTPKTMSVRLSFVEAKATFNSIWEPLYKHHVGKVPKGKQLSNLMKYVEMKGGANDCSLEIGIFSPKLDKSVGKKIIDAFTGTTEAQRDLIKQTEHFLEELKQKDPKKYSEVMEALKEAQEGVLPEKWAQKIKDMGIYQDFSAICSYTRNVTNAAVEGVKGAWQLINDNDSPLNKSASTLTLDEVAERVYSIFMPLPEQFPQENVSHSFETSSIDQLERLQNGAQAVQRGINFINNKNYNPSSKALASSTRSQSATMRAINELMEGAKVGVNHLKNAMIESGTRSGFIFNPMTISTYTGTSIRSYSLSFTVQIQSKVHYDELLKTIIILKYFMTASTYNGDAKEGGLINGVFLTRPHYFSLKFSNSSVDDIYGLSNIPLNLVSMNINYDNTNYHIHNEVPKLLTFNMTFKEVAPRRNKNSDEEIASKAREE